MNDRVIFEIKKYVGTITKLPDGWSKEINIVSWNEGEPKVDIRSWNPGHERMTRGITLTEEEMDRIVELWMNWKQEDK